MSIDHAVADFFAAHHATALTTLAWTVTAIGNEITLFVASLALLTVCLARGQRRDALMVAVGMAGSAALTVGIKNVVQRERPGAEYRVPGAGADSSYSFPSGHTMNTMVFVILLVAVLWPYLTPRAARPVAVVTAAATAVSVGVSRLYLGYHWFTDVMAGLLIGAAWAGGLVAWSRSWSITNVPRPERGPAVSRLSGGSAHPEPTDVAEAGSRGEGSS
ncbi:phosphatase PAP2 family protein [Marmoricola sp. RAF53]|uniref:phosphatase PAP2 family protein n=1 Tax=Marmoricola sp. RAF53 TaxID=3233059 RepID=UPI003F9737C7